MQLYLARTFRTALDTLEPNQRTVARRGAVNFCMNPASPGLEFRRIPGARDREIWSYQMALGLRLIVHRDRGALTLCYVGPREDALEWARRRRLEEHPVTGAMQIVEQPPRDPGGVGPAPLAATTPTRLLGLGAPAEWVGWLQAAPASAIRANLGRLPAAVRGRLWALVEDPDASPPLPAHGDAPMTHPDAAGEILALDSARELSRALEAPWPGGPTIGDDPSSEPLPASPPPSPAPTAPPPREPTAPPARQEPPAQQEPPATPLPQAPRPAPRPAPVPAYPPAPTSPPPAPRLGVAGAVTPFKLSPSRVARYFGFGCHRFLRWNAAQTPAQIAADRAPTDAPESSALQQAIFKSGFAWEERVLTELIPQDRLRVAPPSPDAGGDAVPLSERFFSVDQTLEVLRQVKPGDWIYEPTLRPTPNFYERFGMDPELVTFSDNRPDLIKVVEGPDGGAMLQVIDMKRGDHLRMTYRIQVLLYALQLRDLLLHHEITGVSVDLEWGGVWLGDHPEPTGFGLRAVSPHVSQLLRKELGDLLTAPASKVPWHVNYRCEWCPYLKTCWDEMEATDDISRLTRLTHQGKRFLLQEGYATVAALDAALQAPDVDTDALLSQAPSLAAQRHQIGPRARALTADAVTHQGATAQGLTIPVRREIRVFLTLQREALGRAKYLLGYQIEVGADVPEGLAYGDPTEQLKVLVAEAPAQVPHARRKFVLALYELLSRIDAYNLGQQWAKQLSVQFFAYSAAEDRLLTELLFDSIIEPETAQAAQTLLLYFQGPDLLLARLHPEDNVAMPITVLLNVLGRVLALPVPVSYTLPETLAALGIDYDYPRDAAFHLPLSPTLRSERLYDAWHRNQPEAIAEIRDHAERYLGAVAALLRALREKAAEANELHLYMPKFSLPRASGLMDPLLSRLAFFALYESAMNCRTIRDSRMAARRAIRYSDNIRELEYIADNRYRLLGARPVLIEAGGFPNWLLARDTIEGRRAQVQFNDYYYRDRMWQHTGSRHPALALVAIKAVEVDALGFAEVLTLPQARHFDNNPPQPGERFLLYDRFTDSLTKRSLSVLSQLQSRPPGFFQDLLDRPERLARPAPWPADVAAHLASIRESLGLTQSQRVALDQLCDERVLALWGPPGTGKTWFLSTVILALLEAHRRAGRPLKILVTAFTHAALENVLRAVAKQAASSVLKETLQIGKAGGWKGSDAKHPLIRVPQSSKLPEWLSGRERCVIGGTVWAVDKHLGTIDFDLVVVDEASQVKVPDAAISAGLVSPTGRIVFAGDHLQLPPIVKGVYPDPPEGEVVLHRSVFEAVCGLMDGHFMRQLQENFRMNQTLTDVSAELLYGPQYTCGTDKIAAQRLPWAPLAAHSQLVRACLDPAAPMVVVLLRGLPPGRDNEVEAGLTAELVYALREGLRDKDGQLFSDDDAFFSRGVFVVSPHHSQIHRIRRRLRDPARHAWGATPFVGTVDKMQGQESQAVVVSYGVTDAEYAAREAEFIYSLNRLNVSITRGRAKTVLMISEALLEAAPEVLDREEAERGLSYMRGLMDMMRRDGESVGFFLDEGVEAEVWQLRAR